MGIKQVADGSWSVSYHKRHPTSKQPVSRKKIKIKTRSEAQRVFNSLVVEVENHLKRLVTLTWGEVLEDYFKFLQTADLTNVTRYNREKLLRFHTTNAWGGQLVDQITSDDIYRLLNERLESGSEGHRKFFMKCVKGVFQYAVNRGLLVSNPTPLIKFKIKSNIKNVLKESEILFLLRKAQDQNFDWYPHYAVAVFTGLRNGELYALKWQSIDLEKRLILVNSSWNSKDGFKSTKSGNDRLVEIPNPLMPLLRELKLKSGESDFVLPRLSRWDRGEQAYDLRIFLKSIGLQGVRFHDLRASWATWLLDKGVAPSKVMSQGGWTNLDTMMIYMRKAGIDIKNSTSVFDKINFTNRVSDAIITSL